ncbi:MAG: crotonobetainyl-CoA hydratase [Gammaproteobacteria bacterium]|nr:MAG: crotonobetainyl-CoA hydratase [Gammaproteobacteria bacterium]
MIEQPIITTINNGILWITLNRPKANAIDARTSQQLNDIFDDFEQNADCRVAIIRGAGERFFCAGWDLSAAAEGEAADADFGRHGFGGLATRFDNPKPVIAAVNGMAIGGGFELALCCDLIVAAEHATFALPEAKVGVAPDTGSLRLPNRIPQPLAMEMLLTGKKIDSSEAERLGLLNRVVALDELENTAEALANAIIANAPLAIAAIKQLANAAQQNSLAENYQTLFDKGFDRYETMLRSDDALEGPAAFAEKRQPRWMGM